MIDICTSKEKLDRINQYSYRRKTGGRMKKSFDETHKRVTLYFQNNVFEEVQALREQGAIPNLTEFVNRAVKKELQL